MDVLTAHEDQASELPDPELLDRATALGRVLFTQVTTWSWKRPNASDGDSRSPA